METETIFVFSLVAILREFQALAVNFEQLNQFWNEYLTVTF